MSVAGRAEAVRGRVRGQRVRGRGRGAAALEAREALHLHARRQGKTNNNCFLPVRNASPLLFFAYSLVIFPLTLQHFQRDIVRGVEGYIVTGSKQVELGTVVAGLLQCIANSEFGA